MSSTTGWTVSPAGPWAWPARPVAPGHPTLAPAAPAPADRVFSPLSCRRALPGNVKKRLLMPSRGKAQPSARACVCCAHACAADGSGHVQGQSTRAGPHPAAPAPPNSPVARQRPERCPSGPQLAQRCLLPRGLRLAGHPSFRAQRRSVDCPRSGGPGAPAAHLYRLLSCCDCPRAASLSLRGRLRCACNPACAPAPVGGFGTLVSLGGRWDRAVAWPAWLGGGRRGPGGRSGQGPAWRRAQG